jgi:hypothetical protein
MRKTDINVVIVRPVYKNKCVTLHEKGVFPAVRPLSGALVNLPRFHGHMTLFLFLVIYHVLKCFQIQIDISRYFELFLLVLLKRVYTILSNIYEFI